MTDTSSTLTGHCLCGAVALTVQQASRDIEVCHCEMCRKWSGGPLFCLHTVAEGDVGVTGEEHVVRYRSSDWAERAFCGRCGSNLWYQLLPAGTRTVTAGLFDLPQDFAVTQQIFVDERPHWARLAGETVEKTGPQIHAEAEAAGLVTK
ncbi:GFA family protein [Paracoccus beibuensis]|uniref:GFA family protein n=1 Tax=Paracoccus beibuensis TaxID=547602 RepID=UPI0022408613|nr:GFA family protein [Paracoccus beibuensis]